MEISIQQKMRLGILIQEEIMKEFKSVYLSKNLINTIRVYYTGGLWDASVTVEIPAEIYDIHKFLDEGVIVYTGEGSYASQVNIDGGFSGKHKDYINFCISNAVNKWLGENGFQGGVKKHE